MDDIHERQKEQEDLQRSQEFVDVFSRIVSGKAGYKTVVGVKPVESKCDSCNMNLKESQKFCHECGTKNESDSKSN